MAANRSRRSAQSTNGFAFEAHAVTLGAYGLAIFLSAGLLFSVQPLFAKMVLPVLGGAPSVWSVALVFFQAALLGAAGTVQAERADRDKPTQLEANRMSSDDARRVSIFEGNVVLTKGTITLRGDRIVVRVDAEGFQHATITGNPVRFKQKTDPSQGRPGVWTEAEAQRVEIDEKSDRIELFDKARVTRDQDEVRGDYVMLDQRSDFLSVSAGKGAAPSTGDGRVRAVIQPKAPPSSSAQPPAGASEKPPAR